MKKILALFTILAFTFTSVVPVFAQTQADIEQMIRARLGSSSGQSNVNTREEDTFDTLQNQEEWQTFTCPACEKDFQVPLDNVSEEMKRGLEEVTCPYDGTRFIPREIAMRKALKEDPGYVSIVSPYEKKEFKARLDMDSIASGAVITDPYTGRKFRYVIEPVRPNEEWQEIVNPSDGRKFRIRLPRRNSGKREDISSPYDGSKFDMDWQDIDEHNRPSDIEKMFSREVPITVSKAIKQFGYDIFPIQPQIKRIGEKGEKTSESDKPSEQDNKNQQNMGLLLQKKLLGQEGSVGQFEEGLYGAVSTIPVSDDYILGPGDKLILNLWGNIQQKFDLDIDGEGKIMLPQAGPLYLWGVKFADAKKLIEENLNKYYTNFQISVSMGKLRSIKVFILGEARKPGAYMFNSLATVFDALYQASGPTKIGSLRNIRLTRANKTEEIIDLYSYLLQGDKSQDLKLDSGDSIFIPPIGPVIGVAGNVKRPAIYELKGSDITMSDLLQAAGGISAIGYLQRIQVERIKNHERKVVFDLEFENTQALKNSASNVMLQDGDLVMISAVTPIRHNFVSIAGNVRRPGDYELKPGMKLKDLIDEVEGIMPGAYLDRAELSRFRDDKTREIMPVNIGRLLNKDEAENIELKEWDRFYVFTKSEVIPTFFVRIEGAVYGPGEYELTDNMRISDLIFRAEGLKKTASLKNAELYRSVLGEGPKIMRIDLGGIFDPRVKEKEGDLYLQEGDQLFIREETKWLEQKEITITGEVMYPGKYMAASGERLSSIIKRAGGFTNNAFLPGAIFTRVSVEKYQREMMKKFVTSAQEDILKEESSLAISLSPSQSEARREMIKYRQKQLDMVQSTKLIGRIVIRLDLLDKLANSPSDITLEDGDALLVPLVPSSVQIIGNVYAPNAVTYVDGRGLNYYINRAGGFSKNADKKGIFVIKASGEAMGKFTSVMKIERGDTIIVPELFKYKTPPGLLFKDAFSLTSQFVITALSIKALNP